MFKREIHWAIRRDQRPIVVPEITYALCAKAPYFRAHCRERHRFGVGSPVFELCQG